jgi:hypothetical protein
MLTGCPSGVSAGVHLPVLVPVRVPVAGVLVAMRDHTCS